jgi:hypothetical protein
MLTEVLFEMPARSIAKAGVQLGARVADKVLPAPAKCLRTDLCLRRALVSTRVPTAIPSQEAPVLPELNAERITQLAIQWSGQFLLALLVLALIAAASKR